MKIKRQKRVHRILNFYKHNFGLRPPYQMLIDGTFCQACLTHKINIKDQMPKYLINDVKLLTTQCCILETEKLGPPLYGASVILKQFGVHSCGHDDEPKPAIKCLKSMVVGEENRYIVASQDVELRTRLRKVAGTPILYLHGNTPTLEDPSEASSNSAQNSASERMEATSYQSKVIQQLKLKEFGEEEVKKKRKKKKGPNPLSCLKSKKKAPKDPLRKTDGTGAVQKKKRVRNRKKANKQV